MSGDAETVLLTGGTGRLGQYMLSALANAGYQVRVMTPDRPRSQQAFYWYPANFLESPDFDRAMDGVDIVVHLGAELRDPSSMGSVNVGATEGLALAAERHGAKTFVYTSTVCVYGSPKIRVVNEDAPLIPRDRDSSDVYSAPYFLREYARTKMLGEDAIDKIAGKTKVFILRPTNIIRPGDIEEIVNDWTMWTRFWRGYRNSHYVSVFDVVEAILFAIGIGALREPSEVKFILNVSDPLSPDRRFRDMFALYDRIVGNKRLSLPVYSAPFFDSVKDFIKFRTLDVIPAGQLTYDCSRLINLGFHHKLGLSRFFEDCFIALSRQR